MALCPKCNYEWESKVDNPKKCPRCMRRLDYIGGGGGGVVVTATITVDKKINKSSGVAKKPKKKIIKSKKIVHGVGGGVHKKIVKSSKLIKRWVWNDITASRELLTKKETKNNRPEELWEIYWNEAKSKKESDLPDRTELYWVK